MNAANISVRPESYQNSFKSFRNVKMGGSVPTGTPDQHVDQLGKSSYGMAMGKQVNLYEAKTQLSRLVEEAAGGDTFIIAKNGKPMAELGPVSHAGRRPPRILGQLAGQAQGVDWTQWWRDWKAAD